MSDTYHYEDGAIHNDHKRVVNISGVSGSDLQGLLKSFLRDEAEEARVVSCEEGAPTEENTPIKRSSGRTSESLFDKGQQEQAALFTEFLREHHRFSTEVDTRKSNYVNKAFSAFYAWWVKARLVPAQPNGNACYRFLKDDCGLSMKSEIKTYANFIRAYIIDAGSESYNDVALVVEEFILRKNAN